METELFEELMQSVREAGAIVRGEAQPARTTTLSTPTAPAVRPLRESLGLSQKAFSRALDVSAGTVRNWEQGRRQPTGPARVLLTLVAQQPGVLKFIAQEPSDKAAVTAKIRKRTVHRSVNRRNAKSPKLADV